MNSPQREYVPIKFTSVAIRDGMFRAGNIQSPEPHQGNGVEFKLADISYLEIGERSNEGCFSIIIMFSILILGTQMWWRVLGNFFPRIGLEGLVMGYVAIFVISTFPLFIYRRHWYVLLIATGSNVFELSSSDEDFLKRVKFLIEQEIFIARAAGRGTATYQIDFTTGKIDTIPSE